MVEEHCHQWNTDRESMKWKEHHKCNYYCTIWFASLFLWLSSPFSSWYFKHFITSLGKKIQRAVVSNSWPGSFCIKEKATVPCGIAARELPQMFRGKNWRNPIVPEHSIVLRAACCPNKPCVGSPQAGDTSDSPQGRNSEEERIGASLTCKRHQPLWPDLHQHSPATSESPAHPPSQNLLGLSLLWSHPAQLRLWWSLGSELWVLMPPGVKPSQTHNRYCWARVFISQWHFPSGV